MARYIDIDKMKKWTEVEHEDCIRQYCASTDYDCNECYYNNAETEDVAPVVHAKWEGVEIIQLEVKNVQGIFINKDKIGFNFYQRSGTCSNCHSFQLIGKYCVWCGAKMDR